MHLKNKKILVTGALGFIGRSLLEALIEQNCEAELYGIDIKPFPSNAMHSNRTFATSNWISVIRSWCNPMSESTSSTESFIWQQ